LNTIQTRTKEKKKKYILSKTDTMDLKVPLRAQIDSLINMETKILNTSSIFSDNNAEKKEEIVKIML